MQSLSELEGILANQALLPSQIRAPSGIDLIVGHNAATFIDVGHSAGADHPFASHERATLIAKVVVEALTDTGSATTFMSPDGYVRSGWPVREINPFENISTVRTHSLAFYAAFDAVEMGSFLKTGLSHEVDSKKPQSDLEEEIRSFRELKDSWAGVGSVAPHGLSIDGVAALYAEARAGGWHPARVFVAPDGEVGLAWEAGRGYASVSFWNDGAMSFYARSTDGNIEHGDELADFHAKQWPDELLGILRTFI